MKTSVLDRFIHEGAYGGGDEAGFHGLGQRRNANWEGAVLRLMDTLESARRGSFAAEMRLREAYSSSDFPQLFGDVLDRQLLAHYQMADADYRAFARVGSLRDFRQGKRFTFDGGDDRLSAVNELAEYPAGTDLADSQYTIQLQKYGRLYPVSYETLINDDMDAFGTLPQRMAAGARRTELYQLTNLFSSSTGPHTSMYTSGNRNIINTTNGASSTNPAFSITGLEDGFTVLGNQVDPTTGEPIVITAATLVIPPALRVKAKNLLNATEVRTTTSGGATGQEIMVANWMKNDLTLVVDPYLPIVDTTRGNTAWYLFANPGDGRPALEIAFLRGQTAPTLLMKAPDAIRIGGAGGGMMEPSFSRDAIEYKVRHCLGVARLDAIMSVASNGSGS